MSVPDAPTITSLVAGNATITINFTAPIVGDGITDYKYALNGASYISSGTTTSPIIVSSLTNGTEYSITLVATNSIGDSTDSNAVSETPYTIPSAPTITAITQTDISSASVSFTLGSDNGRAITSVSYSVNNQAFVSANSPLAISGLSPGQTYGIRLLSTNLAGNSEPSASFDVSMSYLFDYRSAMSIDTDGDQFLVVLRKEVSGENNYFVSYDGESWTARTYPSELFSSASPYVVRWTGNQFIVAGDFETANGDKYMLRSSDAKSFSLIKTNLPGKVHDIEIGRESAHTISFPVDTTLCFGSAVAYSHDGGKTWTESIASSSVMSSFYSACWTGKIWVAAGTGADNTIATSIDGTTWIGRGKYLFSTSAACVATNNRITVAVGEGANSLAYSPDGVHWTGTATTIMARGTSVAVNGGMWIALGFASNNSIVCVSSNNGKKWIPISVPFTTTTLLQVKHSNGLWTVFCDSAHYTSADGLVWTTIAGAASPENLFNGTYYLSTNGTQSRYSIDDSTWSAYASISGVSVIRDYAWNKSTNGTANIQSPVIAAGEGAHSLAYSPDGIHWVGLGSSIFSIRGNQVAWNGTVWCAVGAGTNCIAYSYDGLKWNSASVSGDIFTEAFDIAWNGTVFVAVGSGEAFAAVSIDGITWSAISMPFESTGVAWTGQKWIAYGPSGAAYSADVLAQTWYVLSLPGTIPTRMRPLVSKNAVIVSSISGETFDLLSLTLGATDIPVANSAIPGNAYLTSCTTDGIITIVSGENGSIAYISNAAGNSGYVLTPATSSGLTHAYAVSHTGKHTIVAGTGGIVYGSASAGFTPTNASGLMTTVWGLATSVKYGHVICRNTLAVNSGEKLGVVYPRNRGNVDANIIVDMIGI
jgi:hypothetical protein